MVIKRFHGLGGLPCAAVEADLLSGPLGRHWGRFSLPVWSGGESAQPIRLWRRLRRFPGGGRSLNVVCSWGASRRNQAKSGPAGWNVCFWLEADIVRGEPESPLCPHNLTLESGYPFFA